MEEDGEFVDAAPATTVPTIESADDSNCGENEPTSNKLQQAANDSQNDCDAEAASVTSSEGSSTMETAVSQYEEYTPTESEIGDATEMDPKDPLSPELAQGFRILREIMSDANKSVNWAFMEPVDSSQDGLHDYYEKVPYPMWLKKVYKKFEDREYQTITEFVADMRLMLENCYRFNGPDHYISKRGQKLETVMEQKLALLSREMREKTSIAATSGQPIEEKQITGTRRRKILTPHDSSSLLAQLRAEEKEREKEARRLQIIERKQQQEAYEQELADWEDSLFLEGGKEQMVNCWEIPQIGHFLYLCADVLNLGDVVHWELEHSFLLPRESATMELVMTSLLSTPYQRTRLDKKPSMPYHVWEEKLRTRIRQWYKILHEHADCISKTSAKLGIDENFFRVLGMKNPLDRRKYHDLTFYQRVWIMKSLCDWCLEHQESIREAIELQPIAEQNTYILGNDGDGNIYMHFPQFCGADLRVYRQSPFVYPTIDRPKAEKKSRHRERSSSRRKKRKKEKKVVKPVEVPPERPSRDSRLRQNPAKVIDAALEGSTASSGSESEEDLNSGDSGISGSESEDDSAPLPRSRLSLSSKHRSRLLDDQSDTSREATPNRSLRRGRRVNSPDASRESTPSRTSRSSAMTGSRSSTPLDFSALMLPRTTGRKTRNSEAAMGFEYFDSKLVNGISDTEDSNQTAPSPAPSPTKSSRSSKRKAKSRGRKHKKLAKIECDEDEEMCEGDDDGGTKASEDRDSCDRKSPSSNCDKMELDDMQSCVSSTRDLEKSEEKYDSCSDRQMQGEDRPSKSSFRKHRLLLPEDSQSGDDDDDEHRVDDLDVPFQDQKSSSIGNQNIEMTTDECDVKPCLSVIDSSMTNSPGPVEGLHPAPDTSQTDSNASGGSACCSQSVSSQEKQSADGGSATHTFNTDIVKKEEEHYGSDGQVSSAFSHDPMNCSETVKAEALSDVEDCAEKTTSSGNVIDASKDKVNAALNMEPRGDAPSTVFPTESGEVSVKLETDIKDEPNDIPPVTSISDNVSMKMEPSWSDSEDLVDSQDSEVAQVKSEPVKMEPGESECGTSNSELCSTQCDSQIPGEVKMETDDTPAPVPNTQTSVKPIVTADVPAGTSSPENGSQETKALATESTSEQQPLDEEPEPEPEPEIKGPMIGEFTLVASSVEELRNLTAKFSPDADPVKDDAQFTPKAKTAAGKRKRCEQELYDRMLYLLKELEPWEQKLVLAHKKARLKMRKEQENYKEPEIQEVEDVWESEESASEASSDDEDDSDDSSETEKDQSEAAGGDATAMKHKSHKKNSASASLEALGETGDEELEVSSRGRILKKRVIPNNVEDAGLPSKKRRPDQDKDQTPSPTPNILQSGKVRASISGPVAASANPCVAPPGLSVLNINNQTLLVTPGQNPVILQTSQANLSVKNMALLAQLAGTRQKVLSTGQTVTTMPGHGQQAQQVIKSLLAARQSDKQTQKVVVSLASSASSTAETLPKQVFVASGQNVPQQLQAQLARRQINLAASATSTSATATDASSSQKQASAPGQTVCFSYNNLAQLPPAVLQQILRSQGLQLKVRGAAPGVNPAGTAPVIVTTATATPTALTNLMQAGLLPAASATQPSMLRIIPSTALPKNPQTVKPANTQPGPETAVSSPAASIIKTAPAQSAVSMSDDCKPIHPSVPTAVPPAQPPGNVQVVGNDDKTQAVTVTPVVGASPSISNPEAAEPPLASTQAVEVGVVKPEVSAAESTDQLMNSTTSTNPQISSIGQANPGLLKAINSPPKPKYAGNVTVKSLLEDRALRQRGSEPIVGLAPESPAIGKVAGGHAVILNPGAANIQLVCKKDRPTSAAAAAAESSSTQLSDTLACPVTSVQALGEPSDSLTAISVSAVPASGTLDDVVRAVLTDIPTTLPTAQIKVSSPFAMPNVQTHRPITMTTPSAKTSSLSEPDQSLVQGCVMSPNVVASQSGPMVTKAAESSAISTSVNSAQLTQTPTMLQVGTANKAGVGQVAGVPSQPTMTVLQGGGGMQGLVLPPGLVLSPQLLNAGAAGQQIIMQNVLVQTPAGMQLMQVPIASSKLQTPSVAPTQLLVDASGKLIAGNILPSASVASNTTTINALNNLPASQLIAQPPVACTMNMDAINKRQQQVPAVSSSIGAAPPYSVVSGLSGITTVGSLPSLLPIQSASGSGTPIGTSQNMNLQQAAVLSNSTSALLQMGNTPSSTAGVYHLPVEQQLAQKPSLPMQHLVTGVQHSTTGLPSILTPKLPSQVASSPSVLPHNSAPNLSLPVTAVSTANSSLPLRQVITQPPVPQPAALSSLDTIRLQSSAVHPSPATLGIQQLLMQAKQPVAGANSTMPLPDSSVGHQALGQTNIPHLQSLPLKKTVEHTSQPVVAGQTQMVSPSLRTVSKTLPPGGSDQSSLVQESPGKLPATSRVVAPSPQKLTAEVPQQARSSSISPAPFTAGKILASPTSGVEVKQTSPSAGSTKPVILHVTSNDGRKIQVNVAMPPGMTLQQLLQSPQLQQRLASIQNKGSASAATPAPAGPPVVSPQQAPPPKSTLQSQSVDSSLARPKPPPQLLSTAPPLPKPGQPQQVVQPEPTHPPRPPAQLHVPPSAAQVQLPPLQAEPRLLQQVQNTQPAVQASLTKTPVKQVKPPLNILKTEPEQERVGVPSVPSASLAVDRDSGTSAKEMAAQALQLLSAAGPAPVQASPAGPAPVKANTQAESVTTNVTAASRLKPMSTPLSPSKVVLYNVNGQLVTGQGVPVVVSGGMVHPAPHAVANAQLAKKIALLQKVATANKTVSPKQVATTAITHVTPTLSSSLPVPLTSPLPAQLSLSHAVVPTQVNSKSNISAPLPHSVQQNQAVKTQHMQYSNVAQQNVSSDLNVKPSLPILQNSGPTVLSASAATKIISPNPTMLLGAPRLLQAGSNPTSAKTMVLPTGQPVAGLQVLNPRLPGSAAPCQMTVLRDAGGRLQLPTGVQAVKLPDNRIVLQMAPSGGSAAILTPNPAAGVINQSAQPQLLSSQTGHLQLDQSVITSSANQ